MDSASLYKRFGESNLRAFYCDKVFFQGVLRINTLHICLYLQHAN